MYRDNSLRPPFSVLNRYNALNRKTLYRYITVSSQTNILAESLLRLEHFNIFSGTYCKVCNMTIPFRLSKQGYVCRDCSVTVHKPCHVKVTTHCARTSLPAMELWVKANISFHPFWTFHKQEKSFQINWLVNLTIGLWPYRCVPGFHSAVIA